MNFIDKALDNQKYLSDDDFLQAMADIDREPEVREVLNSYPLYIQDVINIIDYDIELQMEGLEGVITGSLAERFDNIYHALMNCNIVDEAQILQQAKQLDIANDKYDEQIAELEKMTALYNDYDSFWDSVRNYIGKHKTK